MAWYNDVGNFFKKIFTSFWNALKSVFKGIYKFLKEFVVLGLYNLFACLAGIVGTSLVALIVKLGSLGGKRALTEREKRIVSGFFPNIDINEVRVRPNTSPLPTIGSQKIITIGYTIYHKSDFKECNLTDMTWLIHELVHVDQFRRTTLGFVEFACKYGHGLSRTYNYEKNPVEKEAFDFTKNHEDEIRHAFMEECIFFARRGANWHRLLTDAV